MGDGEARHAMFTFSRREPVGLFADLDTLRREGYRVATDGTVESGKMRQNHIALGVATYPGIEPEGYILSYENGVALYGDGHSWRVMRRNGTLGKVEMAYGPRLEDWEDLMEGRNPVMDRMDALKEMVRTRLDLMDRGKVGEADESPAVTREEIRRNKAIGRRMGKEISERFSKKECEDAVRLIQSMIRNGELDMGLATVGDDGFEFNWDVANEYIEAAISAAREGADADEVRNRLATMAKMRMMKE